MSRFGDWIRSLSRKKGATAASAPGIRAQNNATILNDNKIIETDDDTSRIPLLGATNGNTATGAKKTSLVDWIRLKRQEGEKQQEALYDTYKTFYEESKGTTLRDRIVHLQKYAAENDRLNSLPNMAKYITENGKINIYKNFNTVKRYKEIDTFLSKKHDKRNHFWGFGRKGIALKRVLRHTLAAPLMTELHGTYQCTFRVAQTAHAELSNDMSSDERQTVIAKLRQNAFYAAIASGEYENIFFDRFKRTKNSQREDDVNFNRGFKCYWAKRLSKSGDEDIEGDVEKILKGAHVTAEAVAKATIPKGKCWRHKNMGYPVTATEEFCLENLNTAMQAWKNSTDAKKFARLDENTL